MSWQLQFPPKCKWITLLCIILFNITSIKSIKAESQVLSVDPADIPLRIVSALQSESGSASGNIRLTITGGDAPKIQFLASDLHHATKPEVRIERGSVTISPEISLQNNQPADFRISINNIKERGNYSGTLYFLRPGISLTQALTVPLFLEIQGELTVAPVLSEQNIQLVRCMKWFGGCALARLFLNGNVTRTNWEFQIDNQSERDAQIEDAEVILHGNHNAYPVTGDQISIGQISTLPSMQMSSLPMTITQNNLLPDQYSGEIRIRVAGVKEPLRVKTTIDVRDGPFWALVAIFLGILLGRIARDLETPAAKKQVKLLPALSTLGEKIKQIQDHKIYRLMANKLQEAKEKIDSETEGEEVASQLLESLKRQTDLLIKLEEIEVNKQAYGNRWQEVQEIVAKARNSVMTGKMDEGEQTYKEVELMQLQSPATEAVAMATPVLDNQSSEQPTTIEKTDEQEPSSILPNWLNTVWQSLKTTLGTVYRKRPLIRLWLHRSFSLLLLIILALIGLQTLYVNTGTAFGAGGLYDYFGLFLWGITADVAQRTLLSLPGAKGE